MKSQLRFVMHPDDESEIVAEILSEEDVFLIDGPLWKTPSPDTFRSIDVIGSYCIIWSKSDRQELSARYIPASGSWCCDVEPSTIQFLRSHYLGSILTEGRFAIGTADTTETTQTGIEQRYKRLSRFVKKHYVNSILRWHNPTLESGTLGRSVNLSKPDAQVWVGPHARRWLQADSSRCVKPFINAIVEAKIDKSVVNA